VPIDPEIAKKIKIENSGRRVYFSRLSIRMCCEKKNTNENNKGEF